MHELSVAVALVRSLSDYRAAHRVRIVAAHVRIGRLSGIDPDALRFAWEPALAGAPEAGLADCRLELILADLHHRCGECGFEADLPEWSIVCPRCGRESLRRIGGSEFRLESIEVENV